MQLQGPRVACHAPIVVAGWPGDNMATMTGHSQSWSEVASPLAAATLGGHDVVLTPVEVTAFIVTQLAKLDIDGRSLCVIILDGTRSCPLPLQLDAVQQVAYRRASRITVLIALGPMPP